MNKNSLHANLESGATHNGQGCAYGALSGVGISRFGTWFVERLHDVRRRPVIWLIAILVSADLATMLELLSPGLILLPLLLGVMVGATVLNLANRSKVQLQKGGHHTIGYCLSALSAAAIGGYLMIQIEDFLHFSVAHISMATSAMPSGLHASSVVLGEFNGESWFMGSVLYGMTFAIAMTAARFVPRWIVRRRMAARQAMATGTTTVSHIIRAAVFYAALFAADAALSHLVPIFVRGLVLTPIVSALLLLSMHGTSLDKV